jgi:hypothetical protein
MKSKNSKLARAACILCLMVAATAIFAATAYPAWPSAFSRHPLPSAGGPVLGYDSQPAVAPAVTPLRAAQADSEIPWDAKPIAAAAVPLRERCILPWNCPGGRCPREEVNVTVDVPKTDTSIASLSPCAEPPADRPFPFGLLLAVLIPVVILAAAAAFAIRVATSRG